MADVYACGITMHRPEGDLYGILGVAPDATTSMIISAYHKSEKTADQVYAFQALTDTFYRRVYDQYGTTDALYTAGFFVEDREGDGIMTYNGRPAYVLPQVTPLGKIRKNLNPTKPMIVLFTTGGFSPIHNGHIAMMEEAKLMAEAQGYAVVGGFFVPGHDSYVGQKYNGTAACDAGHRVAMCEIATQDSDWLDCDPWAAIYQPCERNFTNVLLHIAEALDDEFADLGEVISVGYVYGSDNTGFGLALNQLGYEIPRSTISSKAVREGNLDLVPEKVAEYYNNIGTKADVAPYLVRSEGIEAVDQWRLKVGAKVLEGKLNKFQSTLRFSIKGLMASAGINLKVHLLDVSKQRIKGHEQLAGRSSISLDAFFDGTYQLATSRVFTLAGTQDKPIRRCARPGCADLQAQAANIAPGDYVLVEDDTVTGQTIRDAKAILPTGVNVVDQIILSDFSDFPGIEYYDVVDLRDFLLGTKHGGLCVETIPGNTVRLPYAAPYVNLRTRAKIPASELFDLNRVIWQCNLDFFRGTGLTIDDIPAQKAFLLDLCGLYQGSTLIEDVVKDHLALFPIKGM